MSTPESPGTPASVADDFVTALAGGNLDTAFGAVSPSAEVVIHPTGQAGGPEIAREFFREALAAFPDLMLTVTRRTACGNGSVLVELSLEGTQAAEWGSSRAIVCTESSNVGAVATYKSAGFQQLPDVPDLHRSA